MKPRSNVLLFDQYHDNEKNGVITLNQNEAITIVITMSDC